MSKKKTKTAKVEVKRKEKWQPGDERVSQGHWTEKYKPEYDEIASRLIAGGFNEKALSETFGITESALKGWKRSFPTFKRACNEGKRGQLKTLVANSLREAAGYDYESVQIKTKYRPDGSVVEIEEKCTPMHQSGNATLATFMMCNLSSQLKLDDEEAFKAKQKVEVENRNFNLNISAELIGDQIDKLAGKLLSGGMRQIEAEIIDEDE